MHTKLSDDDDDGDDDYYTLGLLEKVFRFLGFLGFFRFKCPNKTGHNFPPRKNILYIIHSLHSLICEKFDEIPKTAVKLLYFPSIINVRLVYLAAKLA